jgi:hypothetical protein
MVGLTRPANCPRGSSSSSSLAHGSSFHHGGYSGAAAIPGAGAVGPVPRTAASPVPFGILIERAYPGCPETAWDSHRSVWTAIVPRRNHQSPRRSAATHRSGCCERNAVVPRVLRPVRGRGTPSRPKRGPSRTILAWPLRRRPLLDDAGCVPLRRRVRARISARVRPRTGRIRSIGVGSIAPFMTEPTTPAAHTQPEALARVSSRGA